MSKTDVLILKVLRTILLIVMKLDRSGEHGQATINMIDEVVEK